MSILTFIFALIFFIMICALAAAVSGAVNGVDISGAQAAMTNSNPAAGEAFANGMG
jgi:hypothetical protein